MRGSSSAQRVSDFSWPRRRQIAAALLISLTTAVAIVLSGSGSSASDTAPGRGDRLDADMPKRIAVIGDSLAQDLWNGLHKLYRNRDNVEIIQFTKVSTGLVRDDVYDWNLKIKEFVETHDFDTAIVLTGGNDRQHITMGSKRLARFGKAWTKEYGRRVGDMIATLKTETSAVYWLGLPIVRSSQMARDYKRFNKVYREQAEAAGIAYVDTWTLFDTDDGAYTSFGLDIKGVKRRLRKNDGMHFTPSGKLRFAVEIVRILGDDIAVYRPDDTPEDRAASADD